MNPMDVVTTALLLFGLAGWLSFAAMLMSFRAMRSIAGERQAEVRRLRTTYEERLALLRDERLERMEREAGAASRRGGVSRW